MKFIPLTLATVMLCMPLAGCDGKGPFGLAQAHVPDPVDVKAQHVDNKVNVPAASPLRSSLLIAAVEQNAFEQTISVPGVIEAMPEKLVKITPPLAGRIVKLHRSLGDPVKAGEALFTLDSADLGTAYRDDAKAQATLLQARHDFERQKSLLEADISAKKDYEAAQLALTAAQTDARATTDRLAQLGAVVGAKSQREYVLRSPIAGRVVEMAGSQGGYWNDINASIMTVADLSTVWLSASVSEKDVPKMFVGQKARVTLNAYADRPFDAQVKYVGDLLDADTRTVKVRLAIDNRDGRFRPGMFARIRFSTASHAALVVPASALLQSGLYTRVFVETAPFSFESRIVSVGPSLGNDRVEVLSGLKAGERVVVKNGVLLND